MDQRPEATLQEVSICIKSDLRHDMTFELQHITIHSNGIGAKPWQFIRDPQILVCRGI